MECSRCQSKAVYRLPKHSAKRRSRLLRLVCNPYGCADCNSRFWSVKGDLLTLFLLAIAIVAVIGVVAMTINTDDNLPEGDEQFKFSK